MWIAIFACTLQACESQIPFVELIPQIPYSGISSVYFKATDSFYAFSGVDVNGNYLNALQKIYIDTTYNAWRFSEQITGNNPDPRSNYGAFLYDNSYYIFGGIGENTLFNDMWQFDLIYSTWTNVVGAKPIYARHSFAFTSFTGTDNIFYFAVLGGKSYSNSLKLLDFYLYRPDTNSWISKSNYTACSDLPLIGAQLQYNNGNIYLFSGLSSTNNTQNYYTSICTYNIKSDTWQNNSVSNPNFKSSQGGSCLYNGYIYNFFGGSFQRNTSFVLSNMTRLQLSNINAGWTPINISTTNCGDSILARNSFGFNCNQSSLYINGGNSVSGAENSIINITLNNSASTLDCEAEYNETIWPRKRHGSSFIYVTGGMYLFGGIDQEVIMNDLWFYNITSKDWLKITPLGNLPTPRYGHAAASQGNYIVIVGGISYNDEYLQDYFYYRIDLNTWSEIVPISNLPPPIFRTCLVLNFPFFYYIGGKEEFQVTLSIWQYDFTTLEFTQIHIFDPSTDIPIYKHSCFLLPTSDNSTVIVAGPGSRTISDMPSCAIQQFNLTSKPISNNLLYLDDESSILCRSDLIFTYIGYDYVLLAGGQDFNQEVFSDIWALNLSSSISTLLGNFNFTIYSSAYSYINQTLYMYSGLSDSVVSIYTTSSDYFQFFHLNFSAVLPDTPCGLGMFEKNGSCVFCPPGSFSGINRNDICYNCPAGTANTLLGGTDLSQCIPCPLGYYSIPPSDQCIVCNSVDTCYIGTGAYPINETVNKTVKNFYDSGSQPGFYKPKDISTEIVILYIVTACIIGGFIIAFACWPDTRIFFSHFDFYKNTHLEKYKDDDEDKPTTSKNEYTSDTPINEDPALTIREEDAGTQSREDQDSFICCKRPYKIITFEKRLGGFFSGITMILILYLTANSILTYVRINYIENVVLVPIDSLLKEKDFESQHFTLDLMLPSYGDACSQSNLIASFIGDFDPFTIKDVYRDGAICYAVIKFKSIDVIASGEFIELEFTEYFSFTSDIYISLSTDSSKPGRISKVVQNISSDAGNVLRGATPTVFSFSVLPSMYSHTNLLDPHYELLGYRLSSTVLPVVGGQVTINDIAITQNLKIRVEFLRSDIGITTFKYPIIGPIDFFFSIINNFPGTIGLVAILVWVTEFFCVHNRNTGRFEAFKKTRGIGGKTASLAGTNEPLTGKI